MGVCMQTNLWFPSRAGSFTEDPFSSPLEPLSLDGPRERQHSSFEFSLSSAKPLTDGLFLSPPVSLSVGLLEEMQPSFFELSHPVQTTSEKIRFVAHTGMLFTGVPDIGMDRFLVSNGSFLGTRGIGPCFAICAMGHAVTNTPVLGLCHTSHIFPFEDVVAKLKGEMMAHEAAINDEIEIYVVGGQVPTAETPGTLDEELEVVSRVHSEHIRGVLFNQTKGDDDTDSLSVVLTPDEIVVSKDLLFPVSGNDDGEEIFADEDMLDRPSK